MGWHPRVTFSLQAMQLYASDASMQNATWILSYNHVRLCRRAVLHNIRFNEQVASFANAAGLGADTASLLPAGKGHRDCPGGRGGACSVITFSTGERQVSSLSGASAE